MVNSLISNINLPDIPELKETALIGTYIEREKLQ